MLVSSHAWQGGFIHLRLFMSDCDLPKKLRMYVTRSFDPASTSAWMGIVQVADVHTAPRLRGRIAESIMHSSACCRSSISTTYILVL